MDRQEYEHDRLLGPGEAANYLDMTTRFLEARRSRGGGPKYIRIGANRVKYSLADLREWVSERRRTSTSDSGGDGT